MVDIQQRLQAVSISCKLMSLLCDSILNDPFDNTHADMLTNTIKAILKALDAEDADTLTIIIDEVQPLINKIATNRPIYADMQKGNHS